MKILLINPPQTFYLGSEAPAGNLPLGLMYIAAILQRASYQVELLDAFFMGKEAKHSSQAITIGLSFAQIGQQIQTRKPDIIGIAGPFTSQIDNTIKTSQIAKEINPKILTVVGGPHVTLVPQEFLKQTPTVDIVVCGEGEHPMLDIAQYHQGKKSLSEIKGIAYRQNNHVITLNPPSDFLANLDELPYPAYDLVDMEQYLTSKHIGYRSFQNRAISMITSRGCPFNCCFCAVHLHMGQRFRAHSAEYVLDHIQYVVDTYGVKNIFFEDDNLTLDLKRFETICNGLIEKNIKIGWETPNGVRADRLNLALLKKMKHSGAKSIFVGVESGDQQILDAVVCKSLDLSAVVEFAKNAKALGLKTGAFYIIGFPGETKQHMQCTVDFALELKRKYDVGMHLFMATPSYGTRLYEDCKAKGYIAADLSWDAFAQARQPSGLPLITTPDFTPADVKAIAAEALAQYKKLSLLNHLKNPRKALGTAFDQPQLILKYIKNLAK
ncbi:radical SAM protein [Candidatus Bathycorpusculum sp.]|uniref:B12-binding domain-containing radical SAM protein n=1 Tax=Candidatus Bathycorpusculum sp. TaxID=2994959 RepID=UPI00282F9B29|nr:B12-binding domain-containing radical SAM protein [Candidatus Termitimicrobium sp.]MCL2432020.1 B12-binding domain-containing radical SAM protein [Candidatus Termitimicrobium sp.]